MRILISGGFGFVGGRLGQHLQEAGHQIVLGSRKLTAPPEWLRKAKVVKMEWNDANSLATACAGIDVIIHAAGVNARNSATNPTDALAFNGIATARLLDVGIMTGVKKFIYLSTAHVYSSPLVGVITEETCARNLHPYATSHLAGESTVLYASQSKKIDGIVLRLSNVFGAPAHAEVNCWMLLVHDLCRQAVETGRINLLTSGTQLRDFLPMHSVNVIFENLIELEEELHISSALNVGAGYSMSVLTMAELIQQRCLNVIGIRPPIHKPNTFEFNRIQKLEFSISKLAKLINIPSVDMEAEIDDLLRYCLQTFIPSGSGLV